MNNPAQVRRPGLWLGLVAVVAAGIAAGTFPRAMPILNLGPRMTRQVALQRADSFFTVHDLAPDGARTAVRFQADDSLQTYVDLAGGGRDSLNALAQGRDVAVWTWNVRAFAPRNPHEARVAFAPDGRVVGFRRVLAEADERPALSEEEGLLLAREVMGSWLVQDTALWRLATSSYETQQVSDRIDRTYTFERRDRQVAEAPIRMDVVVAGDLPSMARPYVVIPEAFSRRYGEMRSANDLLALLAQLGLLVLLGLGVVTLRRYTLQRSVRWMPALALGAVVGLLIMAAGLNELPGSWFGYDTATSPTTFLAIQILGPVLGGTGLALLVGLTVAAAEAAARHAFPRHIDWWRAWNHRGTGAVAGRVAAGYVVALISLAYVAVFYLVTRNVLGWWVPSELLDDPNLIATPMPWVSAVAVAMQAGVWEESLFRVLPLSLLAIWVGDRPHRRWWLPAGVVATALVFGFAHANYPSWPPYSRGAEIFLDACFWGVLVIWLGGLVTILAHFSYDLILFGLFAASGSAPAYRVTAAIVGLILVAPGLAVVWRWVRQRGLRELPDEARSGAWRPSLGGPQAPPATVSVPRTLTPWARQAAIGAAALALLLEVLVPAAPTLGPPFTATRAQALAAADSVARSRAVDPDAWHRLSSTAQDTLSGFARFFTQEDAEALALQLAETYEPPAWWVVRYVNIGGTAAERAEEWRVRLWPDGRPLDLRHLLPDSVARDSVSAERSRRLARAALAQAGMDTLVLLESRLEVTERPARRDVTVTYTDTALALPGAAAARAWVTLAGEEVLVVRRGIELPETFMRASRERGTTNLVVTLVCMAWLVGLVITLIVLVIRRRPPVLHDGVLGRRRALAFVGILAVFAGGTALNGWPNQIFSYATTMPWPNWVAINAVVVFLATVPSLIALGLWMVVGSLRRRVGIPLLPGGSDRNASDHRRDVMLAGVGLGSTAALVSLGLRLADRGGGIPAAPGTSLGLALPWLGGGLGVPMEVVMSVVALALPGLAVVGIRGRRGARATVAAALVVPLMVVAYVTAPAAANSVVRALGPAGVGVVVAVLSIRWWAGYAGWAWVVGAAVLPGYGGVWTLLHGSTGTERVGGALTVAVCLALLWMAYQVTGPWAGVFSDAGPPQGISAAGTTPASEAAR